MSIHQPESRIGASVDNSESVSVGAHLLKEVTQNISKTDIAAKSDTATNHLPGLTLNLEGFVPGSPNSRSHEGHTKGSPGNVGPDRPPIEHPIGRPPIDSPPSGIGRPPVEHPIGRPPVEHPIGRPPVEHPIGRPPVEHPIGRPPGTVIPMGTGF